MHSFYLRKMYMENKLSQPGGLKLAGVPIDLGEINLPSYLVSAEDDHIAPWHAAYKTTNLIKGDKRFILSASGHIAGVINPPANNKYHYWVNDRIEVNPKNWLEKAELHKGSWWTDWKNWLTKYSGPNVKARSPGSGDLDVIEDAPGSYVKINS
jgi:polyhydroxyalkanoate synthase